MYGKKYIEASKHVWALFEERSLIALVNDEIVSSILFLACDPAHATPSTHAVACHTHAAHAHTSARRRRWVPTDAVWLQHTVSGLVHSCLCVCLREWSATTYRTAGSAGRCSVRDRPLQWSAH